jgi:Rieske Fe-S protein
VGARTSRTIPGRCVRAADDEEAAMATCEVCGNDYDKSFEVVAAGVHHTFDSFECAIHLMAPICEHCGCKVVGHGTEVDGRFFCCAHCARDATGASDAQDRVATA